VKCHSVRTSQSLCLSHHSTAAAACGGFVAERRSGSTHAARGGPPAAEPQPGPQHGAQQQMRAVSRLQLTYMKLNADLLYEKSC